MKICIGTITRNRPKLLSALLVSYAKMHLPMGAHLTFVIIENNDRATVHDVVDAARSALTPWPIYYNTEPKIGIPFARNRVLDEALRIGADYLTFVDDDETVSPNWLLALTKKIEQGPYDLVGGAVFIPSLPAGARGLQRVIGRGMRTRNERLAEKLHRRSSRMGPNTVNVSTCNWIGRLSFFRRTRLRFDEAIGQGSGSDRQLYKDLVRLGGTTSFTKEAYVCDTIPLSRLTLGYQLQRGRDQKGFHYSHANRREYLSSTRLFAKAIGRLPRIALAIIALPITGGTSIVEAARLTGDMLGFLDAARGHARRGHYETATGE
jgi:hypothetical protein